ncbi:ribbon-helix-helix protein, CopG family [Hydrogenophaga sp.]|uniref:ribbon-helix-helix protein, CopG family n=1 Tax=Hydrogenophaga sp. TaxID=1904254 RepID=UPI002633460D|nr:ribbon-helix-helix protein, CopG family [Hydrogenophaga sp.]MDM7951118.1 ribbon-helix-helix protein, CopG family [Hydrogenophaga sp.]
MPPTIATSLKLPAELKAAIDEDARKQGLSSHAYMVQTLADASERVRLREQFTQDTLAAERQMLATGLGHRLEDVQAYFAQMAEFRAGQAERPVRLVPKKLL